MELIPPPSPCCSFFPPLGQPVDDQAIRRISSSVARVIVDSTTSPRICLFQYRKLTEDKDAICNSWQKKRDRHEGSRRLRSPKYVFIQVSRLKILSRIGPHARESFANGH